MGLSFSSRYGVTPRASFGGGGRNHFYAETVPLSGVEGDLDITGSLQNDSVPVTGDISGDFSFSYRAPITENAGYSIYLSGINLSSTSEFSQTFANAVKSGLIGYAAGRVAQEAGLGDFASSLVGSATSAYARAQLATERDIGFVLAS